MGKNTRALAFLLPLLGAAVAGFAPAVLDDGPRTGVVVDNFEGDRAGAFPSKWRFLTSRDQKFRPLDGFMNERERFVVRQEGGNKFLRAYTEAEAQRISIPHDRIRWRLSEHPRLQWRWRALQLPPGAREDDVNDTGGALYVSFAKKDWLGRPLSIKYTYSSTLPVGTIVSTGNVKIIVASSGADGKGKWVHVVRNVVDDYRTLFGGAPPEEPFTITLWSDSDDTETVGEVDFDDITLLPGPGR